MAGQAYRLHKADRTVELRGVTTAINTNDQVVQFNVQPRLTRGSAPIARLVKTALLSPDPDSGKPRDASQPEGEPRS